MRTTRRTLLVGAGLAAGFGPMAHARSAPSMLQTFAPTPPLLDLSALTGTPLPIARFEMAVFSAESALLRVVAANGAEGVTPCSPSKWRPLTGFFRDIVMPYFVGRDARTIETIHDDFARKTYEWQGTALWIAFAHAEHAVLDLLGRAAGKPVAALFASGVRRRTVPIYISSNRRGVDVEAELDLIGARMAETGATGAKIKVGGRMSANADAAPGWTDDIVARARARLGDGATLYADANGSYDAPTALRLARRLAEHRYALFEEPCPGEERAMTAEVAARAPLPIAGGENEFSLPGWREMIARRTFDIVQPDPLYAGGMLRCARIAQMAAQAGLGFNPHWPRNDAETAPLVHLCAIAPALWGLQEYRLRPYAHAYPHTSAYRVRNGALALPDAAGFGVTYDPQIWTRQGQAL